MSVGLSTFRHAGGNVERRVKALICQRHQETPGMWRYSNHRLKGEPTCVTGAFSFAEVRQR